MKHRITLIAAVLLVPVMVSAETLFIAPAEIQCPPVENNLSVTVDIRDADDVASVQFDLLYDPDALEFLAAEKGDFFSSALVAGSTTEEGKLSLVLISVDGEDGNGTIFHFDFKVKEVKESELILSEVEIFDSSITQIDNVTTEGATMVVQGCPLEGDTPPCGEVEVSEVIDFINQWVSGTADLSNVINLISAWTS